MEKQFLFGAIIIGVLLIIGIGAVAIFYNFPEAVAGGELFAKPDWARLECSPTDAYEGKDIKWLDQQSLFKCDGNTEECRFTVETTSKNLAPTVIKQEYYFCNLDGNDCGGRLLTEQSAGFLSAPKILGQFNIPSGKSVKFSSASFGNIIKVTQEWKPWKVYRFVGGSKSILNSQDCKITSSMKERIRQEDNVDTLYRTGGEGQKWINYVNDWVYGPATNIYDYQGQKAYCTNGAVYSIVKLKMADGKLIQINPEYSDTTESGDSISGLGNKIASVECCPNEPTCTKNFEYVKAISPEIEDKECFTDLQCFNAGGNVPETQTSYTKTTCIQNKCVKSAPITVECTTNSACSGGAICDLSTTNYGKCILQKTGEYCGDKICQITESSATCQVDCGSGGGSGGDGGKLECPFGQTFVGTTKEVGTGFLGLGRLVGSTETKTIKECQTAGWLYAVVFSVAFILMIVLIILIVRLTRR